MKKLIACEIREEWTFTITFPSQQKMLNWVLKREAKCWRDRLGFCFAAGRTWWFMFMESQWNLVSINDTDFIDNLGDYELLQH